MAKYKTDWTNSKDIKRKWHLVNVDGQILGRVATEIAGLLMGRGKVERVPNVDCGDYVVVINSAKVVVSGGKEQKKMYYRHSGFPGGFKETRYDAQMKKNPNFIIEEAVTHMLPQTKLKDGMAARLFVYSGSEHDHNAQKPVEFKLS